MTGNEYREMRFPYGGMDLSRAFCLQPARPTKTGDWVRSTIFGRNVRSYEPNSERYRGGNRPGVVKYLDSPIVDGWIVQELGLVVGTGYQPPGGTMQSSASGRVVSLVGVSQGAVSSCVPGGTSWTVATNATGRAYALNYTGIVRSTQLNQKLWFVDGTNYAYFDPATNTVYNWAATEGSMPASETSNKCRLICTWRGRIVMSGALDEPHNWFMSKVSEPTVWNYFQDPPVSTQAVKGNNSALGLVGDMVTCLIPYSDDVLIVGGDSTIYAITGDPMLGGQIDLVTSAIGMAWGNPWCMDPMGQVYFMSNRTGIYIMTPGAKPQRISQQIEQLLLAYNTGHNTVRMFWNDRFQGVHVFISPTVEPSLTTHFFWEQRSGAWWMDQFADTDFDPLCGCVFDGNLPEDRAVLIGSWDGYVRSLSTTATQDDGRDIESVVVLGPLNTRNLDQMLLRAMQAVLAEDSGDVDYEVYVGSSAEIALSNDPVASGTWSSGRNLNNLINWSGHNVYVKLTSSDAWAMEQIRFEIASRGKVSMRGH